MSYKFKLRGYIHSAGFRTLADFCGFAGVDSSRLSLILNGWLIPGETLRERLKSGLGLDDHGLDELLSG